MYVKEINLPWSFFSEANNPEIIKAQKAFTTAKKKDKKRLGKIFIDVSKKVQEEDLKKSFSGLGLATPGTLIQYYHKDKPEEVKQALIGDMNTSSGTCGCCGELSENHIILRYRVLKLD